MDSYLQLFIKGLKPGRQSGTASAVAFTSTLPGEGVSYVTQSFAMELARRTRKNTIIADIATLQKIDIFHYSQVSRHCCKTDVAHLFVLQDLEDEFPDVIDETESSALLPRRNGSELDRGLANLQTLRFMFDFILVDCSSLKSSGDATLFASAVDGVILVVEAEKTRKEQVRSSLETMEMADANILGCVLNKRQYPVPDWLYRRI
jgi:Mrp family chromosome partitioning ATPase